MELKPGTIFSESVKVTPEMSATKVGSGLVDVLATPAMIAFIEKTASEGIAKYLQPNEVTVGFEISVKHVAPSMIGTTIQCKVQILQIVKNKINLSAVVTDQGKIVALANHTRVIVDKSKFMEKYK